MKKVKELTLTYGQKTGQPAKKQSCLTTKQKRKQKFRPCNKPSWKKEKIHFGYELFRGDNLKADVRRVNYSPSTVPNFLDFL